MLCCFWIIWIIIDEIIQNIKRFPKIPLRHQFQNRDMVTSDLDKYFSKLYNNKTHTGTYVLSTSILIIATIQLPPNHKKKTFKQNPQTRKDYPTKIQVRATSSKVLACLITTHLNVYPTWK